MKLNWEFFIRIAFGFKENKGREISMGGDPAGMANNEYFNNRHFYDIAVTTGYAMQILNQDVKTGKLQCQTTLLLCLTVPFFKY
ncbi:MAG: hypothetical protein EPN82_12980 [Bacteroidetes bacterium]|nr:MAG: hypothetical protein EPN82_12980 [Bacteroidota bacterium]